MAVWVWMSLDQVIAAAAILMLFLWEFVLGVSAIKLVASAGSAYQQSASTIALLEEFSTVMFDA